MSRIGFGVDPGQSNKQKESYFQLMYSAVVLFFPLDTNSYEALWSQQRGCLISKHVNILHDVI